MVSEKEIEARAVTAFVRALSEPGAAVGDRKPAIANVNINYVVRAALEAAALARAENDAFRDAVVTGLGAVKMNADGTTERVDLRAEANAGAPISLMDAEKAFLDRVWPRLQNGCYRTYNSIPIEIKWLNFNEFVRDGLCAVFEAAARAREEAHPDDAAVDRFAAAMKAKLKWEREERGRYGWNDPEVCSEEYLAKLLIEHLAKGNEGNFEDIANFCMMLHQRGAHPRVLADVFTSFKTHGEKIMSRKQTDNRFWRIKKGEPIPEWLEKGATAAGMVAGDDLIVIPSETEGYDVYLADPNSNRPMMKVTAENMPESFSITGAPTCFRMASSLHYTIGTLQKENKALADALRGLLQAYENAFDWSAELPPETAEAEHIANEVLHALTAGKPEQEGAALNKEGQNDE